MTSPLGCDELLTSVKANVLPESFVVSTVGSLFPCPWNFNFIDDSNRKQRSLEMECSRRVHPRAVVRHEDRKPQSRPPFLLSPARQESHGSRRGYTASRSLNSTVRKILHFPDSQSMQHFFLLISTFVINLCEVLFQIICAFNTVQPGINQFESSSIRTVNHHSNQKANEFLSWPTPTTEWLTVILGHLRRSCRVTPEQNIDCSFSYITARKATGKKVDYPITIRKL